MRDLSLISDMPKTIRRLIIAKPGYELIRADYGQIEARVIGWLSGDENLLSDFLDPFAPLDEDIYCKFASIIDGRNITKKDKKERQVGKTAVLGLAFGMGAERFKETVKDQTGIDIDIREADRIKSLYRTRYYKVRGIWSILHKLFNTVIKTKTSRPKCNGCSSTCWAI